MTLQEKISDDIREAMKTKDVDRLAALRAVKSAIMLEATKDGSTSVSDDMSLKIIARLVKQRKDSASIYIEQNRQDLAQDEMNQLTHLEGYLPEQLDEDEVRLIVQDVIKEINASSLSDMGKCIGVLLARLKGKADGSLISSLVKEYLS